MAVSKDLIARFLAATEPKNEPIKAEVVNATTIKTSDGMMVILDGADSQNRTPVSTTADVKDGERVRVEIRNHQATIVGNSSSPAARSATVADLSYIVSRSITTDELSAVRATISELYALAATIEELNAIDLTAEKATINELYVQYGEFDRIKVEDIEGINATLDEIKSKLIETNVLTTTDLEAVNGSIDNLKSANASITSLGTQYANIDFENVGTMAAQNLMSKSGVFEDLTFRDGVVTGKLVAVSIDAGSITSGSLAADRLMLQGDDGLYYRLNINALGTVAVESLSAEEQQQLQNGIHGKTIIANSITADKINVSDLSAFEATIGGLNIADGGIHSFAKTSVGNTTSGIYVGADGQFNLGNNESAIMFYKDMSGNFKLSIAADEIRFGSSKKLISDAVKEISDASIVLTEEEYATSSSPTTPPNSGWSPNVPDYEEGSYVWRRSKNTYGGGAIKYSKAVMITGMSGGQGEDAVLLRIESSRGTVFKSDSVSTVLSAVIYKGSSRITTMEQLRTNFGIGAYLQWKWKHINDDDYGTILSTDSRIGNDGFTFTLSPQDFNEKVTFVCDLII